MIITMLTRSSASVVNILPAIPTIFHICFFDPIRNNPEHLLAELVVPLMTESVAEGTVFWVSAVSLVQALQAGPGRIDGTVFFSLFYFYSKIDCRCCQNLCQAGKI